MKKSMILACSFVAGCALFLDPGVAPCAAETVQHTIRSGDNLHLIAGYYYRDPRQWKKIWKLNRKSLKGPNRLVPGKTLLIETSPGEGWEAPYEEFLSRVRGT